MEQLVEVREDPRIEVDPAVRRRWTETLLDIGELRSGVQALAREIRETYRALEEEETDLPSDDEAALGNLVREVTELMSRIARLEGSAQGWVGPLSSDQDSQRAFFRQMYRTLTDEWDLVRARIGE
jgi:hypothetical protein